MLFDFQSYIAELRENDSKKESVEQYEKYVLNGEAITGDVYDQEWYIKFVSKFKSYREYNIPYEIKDDFDWELLYQFLYASVSSHFSLIYKDDDIDKTELPEMEITVVFGETVITKRVSELWGFQILRLFEIYVEEQMNRWMLACSDEKERIQIEFQNNQLLASEYRIKLSDAYADVEKANMLLMGKQNDRDLIYHYTPIDCFSKIINSKEFFASDLRYLNDSSEIINGTKIAQDRIQVLLNKTGENHHHYKVLKWLSANIEEHIIKSNYFAACFSHEGNLLSQWRAYADNGKGFSIGFNKEILLTEFAKKIEINYFEVVYGPKEQENQIINYISNILRREEVITIINNTEQTIDQISISESVIDLEEFNILTQRLKNPNFKEENEFRIVIKNKEEIQDKICVRPGKQYFIPYIPVNIDFSVPGLIQRIYYGPTMDNVLAERALKQFLKIHGLDERVVQSSGIPYRI